MLQRVDGVVAQRGLVEHRQVPDVEVERPGHDRHDGMGEHAQAPGDRIAQHRGQQRAGQAQHDQQRGDVADQQVLDHVGDEQLVGERVDRRAQGEGEHDQPGARSRPAASPAPPAALRPGSARAAR